MKTLAADLIADDTFSVAVIIAAILFAIGAVMALLDKAYPFALVAAGLAAFAFAWVTIS